MKKRFAAVVLAALITVLAGQMNALAAPSVTLSQQGLVADGRTIACELYAIDGSNYIRLRDLAYILNGTGSQFSVDWDGATNTVAINTGDLYKANGSELTAPGPDNSSTAAVSSQKIQLDGETVTGLTVYNIEGSNYFKIRELGDALGFGVDYDAAANAVIIQSKSMTTIDVSTAAELLNAIGPNRKISLSAGTYDLSSVNISAVKNNYVSWETVYDGTQVVITGVKNLTISGAAGAEATTVVVKPRYANVLNFSDCANITLNGLTVGHTEEPGYCTGGVLHFSDSKDIGVEACVLYGSGTYGIIMDKVTGLTVSDTDIKECTYGIMTASESSSLSFNNSNFYDCVEFTMITLDNCDNVAFNTCSIKNNTSDTGWDSLVSLSACDTVTFNGCTISGNRMTSFLKVFNSNAVSFKDNTIQDNTFAAGIFAEGSETNVSFSPAL
ncbi:Copper amine oxidase N-terminal domain-containing protein [Sporobacter termitidis DSM 10068]|uniref:Copper amine oxidase N-terminal domain-containing protein n=1 Tax=Sporobacter termitidis DSM 10068 TaxID=1123282 RepID=A0A1M5ZES5_9FIRM|nr:right-handed parallel beta-helix repeat-containing protein [Sporobacter termitidis]SHI22652.1 Copper amine oxidase N-terminal domain-containing protein [Sporobacter termitidis DSM 10068]